MKNTFERAEPSSQDRERAEKLNQVIEALTEVNRRFPVVVEGRNDRAALRKLGLSGNIIMLHGGKGLYEFAEDLAAGFPKVVLLLDWDSKGDHLFRRLAENLSGQWEEFGTFRELLRLLCQKEIKDVESIPALLLRLGGGPAGR